MKHISKFALALIAAGAVMQKLKLEIRACPRNPRNLRMALLKFVFEDEDDTICGIGIK